jgi:hypothetical protein
MAKSFFDQPKVDAGLAEIQIIIDEWKDEDMFWIDPAHIPIIADPILKPNEVYMVDYNSGTWTRLPVEPKPKTRFEMIIEKTI